MIPAGDNLIKGVLTILRSNGTDWSELEDVITLLLRFDLVSTELKKEISELKLCVLDHLDMFESKKEELCVTIFRIFLTDPGLIAFIEMAPKSIAELVEILNEMDLFDEDEATFL